MRVVVEVMDKAHWSPINTEPASARHSPATKKPPSTLARLPINFPNRPPMRTKEPSLVDQYTDPLPNNPSLAKKPPPAETGSRQFKPREYPWLNGNNNGRTSEQPLSPPATTISSDDPSAEWRRQGKSHDVASNGRSTASLAASRAGTLTPKAAPPIGTPTITGRPQPQRPNPAPEANKFHQQLNIPPPIKDPIPNENKANSVVIQSRQSSVKGTPGPRDTPVSVSRDLPNNHSTEPPQTRAEPIQGRQAIEADEPTSSSSDDDDAAANPPTSAGRKAEAAVEGAESSVGEERDVENLKASLPDDHPIEWLAEARETYHASLPPFVTKQKLGVRRMVELPLTEGQKDAGKIEVVYRFWDAGHTFASIDKDGQRFIVKVFRGGATPYRPWLGPQKGFSETALAFSRQGPRGLKTLGSPQGRLPSLPKGWALKEDDERDDDYDPANRRKSFPIRRRRRLNYELIDEEEDRDEDPDHEKAYREGERLQHSRRSSIEGDYAMSDPTDKQPLDSNRSTAQPPSQLINAVKKSLRLPKEQEVFQQPKQIKRRSIGGRGITNGSVESKRQKHKAVFSSDSEDSVPHKRAKPTKAGPHPSLPAPSASLEDVSPTSTREPLALDTPTLSPYKQSHTTLRISLVPYPQQFAVQRLRSCMTMATFFSTVIGVSGYRGERGHIFGISATFDCKPEDDVDRSMVVREDWPDSFDVFIETVDRAESWNGDGGKCGVSVKLLAAER